MPLVIICMNEIIRRGSKGLGKTANGGNDGSFASHERESSESPKERMQRIYEEAGADLSYEEDYANVLGIASRKALSYDGQWVDRDDITQDAVIRVLEQAQKRGYTDVSKEAKDGGRAGVVAQAVTHSIIRVKHQGEHHTAVSGRKRLNERRQEREASLGRNLSPAEVEDLAEDVRMNDFAPGRRPSPGYHVLRIDSLSTEERDEDGRLTNYGTLATEDEYPSHADAGDSTAIGQLADRVAAGKNTDKAERAAEGGISAAEGRKMLWNTYRSANPEIPELQPVAAQERREAQNLIEAAGGAHKVAGSWLDNEEVDPKTEAAFFAPWGSGFNTTTDQKIAVAEKIASNRDYAEHLWAAALGVTAKKS